MNSWGVAEEAAITVVTAATPAKIHDWSDRRGWYVDIVSAGDMSYIFDYAGFETDDPAVVSCMNVFRKAEDGIRHFRASELLSRSMDNGHPRHVDMIWPMWNLLDMTPGGRGDAIVPTQDFEHHYFSENILGEGQ